MKQRLISLVILLTYLIGFLQLIGATRYNVLNDYDPKSAPLLQSKLDFSKANFFLRGRTTSVFNNLPPIEEPSLGPAIFIVRSKTKEIFWQVGANYWAYANETMAFNLFTDPATICATVKGYNYTNYLADFDYLRISSSKKLNAPRVLHSKLAKKLTSRKQRASVRHLKEITDCYFTYGPDIGAPVRNGTGCQPIPFGGKFDISRALFNATKVSIPVQMEFGQYFPGLIELGLSNDNSVRGFIIFDSWKPVNSSLNIFEQLLPQAVQQACTNPIDFCTQMYNTDTWRAQLVA